MPQTELPSNLVANRTKLWTSKHFRRRFLPLIPAVVLAVVWEWYTRAFPVELVPTFSDTAKAWLIVTFSLEFWSSLLLTGEAFLYGWILSSVLGVLLGFLLGLFPSASKVADPYLDIAISVPVAAAIPLIVIIFGLTKWAQVAVIFLFAFPFVVVNAMQAVKGVSKSLIQMGQSYGCNFWQLLRRIIIPGGTPTIMAGVRLGTARCLVGMITVELILITRGLGNLVMKYNSTFRTDLLFALVIDLLLLGAAVFYLVQWIESSMTRWKQSG